MNFKKYHVSRNLFDMATVENGKSIAMDGSVIDYEKRCSTVTPIDVSTYSNVTLSFTATFSGTKAIYALFNVNTLVTRQSAVNSGAMIDVSGGNKLYICFYDATETVQKSDLSNVMLNDGSTPLPYEPYSSEVWHDIPHYIMGTDTDTITTLPAVIYANDTTATVGLKGNMEQNGTPTPDNPIQPQECGERTGNLFDESNFALIQVTTTAYRYGTSLGVLSQGTYTFNATKSVGAQSIYLTAKLNGVYSQTTISSVPFSFTADGESEYIIRTANNTGTTWEAENYSDMMLNLGSTALPYEPYGIKIPISSASTTTPVYLGEVQTTRKIKKLVLTGTETVAGSAVTGGWIITNLSDSINNTTGLQTSYCSHYIAKNNGVMSSLSQGEMCISTRVNNRINFVTTFASAEDFKAYLAAQYAAGTPVTIWYVLATPTTGIVNEPLRKIGDYADTVSGITIPTIAGANTLSVGTTLQPSEVSVTYKGWHPVPSVHERENGQWD